MVMNECLKSASYRDATIVPRGFSSKAGLYDKNGEYVKYSGKRRYGTDIYVFDDEGGVKEKEIKYIDEKVYYLGDLRCHYGHFLIDEASRLWGILEENADVRVVCFLALEQMPQSRLLILKRPTKFTEVLFYTPAYISGKYISNQY